MVRLIAWASRLARSRAEWHAGIAAAASPGRSFDAHVQSIARAAALGTDGSGGTVNSAANASCGVTGNPGIGALARPVPAPAHEKHHSVTMKKRPAA